MDWTSFAWGAASATFVLMLARPVRGARLAEDAPAPKAHGPFADLAAMTPAEVGALLGPLTDREAMVVIVHLDPDFADVAVSLLPDDRQARIIAMLQAGPPATDAEVARVVSLLRLRLGRPAPPAPPARPATAPLAFLQDLPAEMVASKLRSEHPYLAAYVLEHLPAVTRDRVLALLAPQARHEVADLLGRGEPLTLSGEAFVELLGRLRAA